MNLSQLTNGQSAYISALSGSTQIRRHLEEMGFIQGQEVTRVWAAPPGTPIVFKMNGQRVALRRCEAKLVEVAETQAEALAAAEATTEDFTIDPLTDEFIRARHCHGNCAGCPSCGPRKKHAHTDVSDTDRPITICLVGNPNCGKTAFFNAATGGHERTGNYAGVTVSSTLGHTTLDGHRLRIVDLPGTYSLRAFSPEEAYVANELARGRTDVVVNVMDATNLERNLLLTLQIKAMGLPMVCVLNMYDEVEHSGSRLDVEALQERLGVPVVTTAANRGRGVKDALRAAISLHQKQNGSATPKSAESLSPTDRVLAAMRPSPYVRAKAIRACLDGIYVPAESKASRLSTLIDKVMARTAVAYLVFFALMGLIFYATFTLGAYPMDWMTAGIDWLSASLGSHLDEGWAKDLLLGGVVGGVGSVIVFLPNILILYFFISILEDSGYMARTALLADPLLRRMGLHGKSFIPMMMGFGCNVPAVMATRTIESRKSRLITMMTLPFMSCSARLPVYTVVCGAFFPSHAALVMLCLYVAGIVMAFVAAAVLSRFIHPGEESHFVMEMPPYRMPVIRGVVRHSWEKGRQYLRKMGGIILVAAVVVWALGYFPSGGDESLTPAERQEQSYLGQIGRAIEPVTSPLGCDWRMGVGIVAGVGAKELVVSTLGVLYNNAETDNAENDNAENDNAESSESHLIASMTHSGITPAAALGFLAFVLLYFPCLATIAAIKAESGRWKYAIFTAVYTTLVAYALAFVVYRLALIVM